MKTSLDCLPCLYKQALYTARLCSDDPAQQRLALKEVGRVLEGLALAISPPVNSIQVYSTLSQVLDCPDPFFSLKRISNEAALSLAPMARRKIEGAIDPLRAALAFALAGNIMDYGSHQHFDIEKTLEKALENHAVIDDYPIFLQELEEASTILFLGDNCGEMVFDGLLIERLGKEVVFAVKEGPIINDALMEDAVFCGLDRVCQVISNGTDCPGTPLEHCSPEFRELFEKADMVISKGQGNFETLSEVERPIYFLLTVKCPIVGQHIVEKSGKIAGLELGETVIWRMGKK